MISAQMYLQQVSQIAVGIDLEMIEKMAYSSRNCASAGDASSFWGATGARLIAATPSMISASWPESSPTAPCDNAHSKSVSGGGLAWAGLAPGAQAAVHQMGRHRQSQCLDEMRVDLGVS